VAVNNSIVKNIFLDENLIDIDLKLNAIDWGTWALSIAILWIWGISGTRLVPARHSPECIIIVLAIFTDYYKTPFIPCVDSNIILSAILSEKNDRVATNRTLVGMSIHNFSTYQNIKITYTVLYWKQHILYRLLYVYLKSLSLCSCNHTTLLL
jgi:hypothetical protein